MRWRGRRAPSLPRRTTRAIFALARAGSSTIPSPRISSRPLMLAGALACKARFATNRMVRSSATSLAPSSISRKARSDFPAPLGPSSSTPCGPIATQLAWTFISDIGASDIERRHRQFDDQARAAADLGRSRGAVLGIDAPAGALDDLPGDGKSQTRIASEIFARPLGVETVEDGFQVGGRNAGPFIFHCHAGNDVALGGGDDHLATFRT